MEDLLNIEVAYATREKQKIVTARVKPGTDVRQAAAESGIAEYFPEIDFETCDMGVFGKKVPPGYDLLEGDRIEIYRPLIADPKEVRKQRAAQGLRTKKGGGAITDEE